jgi:hypothetical protein
MNTHQHSESSRSEKLPRGKRKHLSATDFSEADQRKFWSRVKKGAPDECWNWTASLHTGGYGLFYQNRTTLRAHRIAMLLLGNNIESMCVCHKCDNPQCVNPAHLFLGTQQDNIRDCETKGRMRKDGMAKLTIESSRDIRELYATGKYTTIELGWMFGVHNSTISRALTNQSWRATK